MLSDKHKEDLYSSGLEDKIIEEIGFRTCDEEEANRLLDRKDIDCQCLILPYPGVEDYFRLKPDGIITDKDGKPAKYLQKGGSESRLFIHQAVRETMLSNNGALPLLIVEGEKKTAKATQDLFFKEKLFYPIGISGVYNWKTRKRVYTEQGDKVTSDYITDLKKLSIDNKLVYICFDSNKETNPQVRDAENELGKYMIARGATRVLNIRIPHDDTLGKHGIGLDDYLVKNGVEKFKGIVSNADSTETIRHSIKFIRKLPSRTFYEKVDEVVKLIIKDLTASGSFYFDNNWIYYFNNSTKIMLQIEEDSFSMKLANDYGLYRDNPEFKAIINKLEEYAKFNGSQITIKNVSYFDNTIKSLYVYSNKGIVFEIPEGSGVLQQRFNGYRDIFFKHRTENAAISYKEKSKGYFERHLLDICNFQYTEFTKLSPDQQRFLFTIWFYSLFFPNLLPTKPILVMTGDYGSGKSTIQRLVGKLLFGSNFNVSTIQGERDFLTSIINKYFLVYDNVDINEEWVRNAIASLSTGFKVEVRKMYSNMEIFQADPIAYLAMNSMTQGLYKRPDVASRLLIFRTKRLPQFIPAQILEKNIEDNRNEILSEVFDNLQGILKFIDDKFTYYGSFRMADFANLGFKIATYFGREKEFEIILDIMSREQSSLPMEDNPLVDLFDKWLNIRQEQKYLTTGELYAQLQKVSNETGLFFPFKSSVSFGRTLQTTLENLKLFYDIASKRGGGNKLKWLINFRDKKENQDG